VKTIFGSAHILGFKTWEEDKLSRARDWINRHLLDCGYRVERTQKPDLFAILLWRFIEVNGGDLQFIQVGANDGVSYDPLRSVVTHKRVSALGAVIEPVPRFFDLLTQNYANYPSIKPLNIAIHNEQRAAHLYFVDERSVKGLPQWALGIASFDRDHLIRSGVPEDEIKSREVPCKTISEVYQDLQLSRLDLLQIDTEGYDATIIRGLDFTQISPRVIHFEHGLRDGLMSEADFFSLVEFLNAHGYQVLPEDYDAIAFKPNDLFGPLRGGS